MHKHTDTLVVIQYSCAVQLVYSVLDYSSSSLQLLIDTILMGVQVIGQTLSHKCNHLPWCVVTMAVINTYMASPSFRRASCPQNYTTALAYTIVQHLTHVRAQPTPQQEEGEGAVEEEGMERLRGSHN